MKAIKHTPFFLFLILLLMCITSLTTGIFTYSIGFEEGRIQGGLDAVHHLETTFENLMHRVTQLEVEESEHISSSSTIPHE